MNHLNQANENKNNYLENYCITSFFTIHIIYFKTYIFILILLFISDSNKK